MSRKQRQAMIDRDSSQLSLIRQCTLLDISRASLYYQPTLPRTKDLDLMALMDRQYLKTPFYGSRRMMRLMGLEAIYRRPNTSKPTPEHRIYRYLLKGVKIYRANQVWTADITYIPMAQGFLYLVAIMDWYSRYVLAWRLSNTLEVEFCVEALEDALGKAKPEIFNTDQSLP